MPVKRNRVRIDISFEINRTALPSRKELEAAFDGAINGVVRIGELHGGGRMGARFVRAKK